MCNSYIYCDKPKQFTMRFFSAEIFIVIAAALTTLVSSGCYEYRLNTYPFEVSCLNNDTYLRITCHSDEWYKSRVKLDLPAALSVGFIDCSFPNKTNLPEILRSMNVTVKEHVAILGRYRALTRENLRGLSVSDLQLSGGQLNETHSDLMYSVNNLRELHIISGDLVRIPEAFFADWAENIVTLQLFKNKLRKIAKNDFAQLVNVRILDLRYNEIDEIETGAFDSLTHLHTMRLDDNQLRTLPTGIFRQVRGLTDISMSRNAFDELPQNLFNTTVNLTIFTLIKNNGTLKTIPNGLFKNLSNLETIYIEGSRVENLPADLFAGCSRLSRVSLEGNQLRNLPAELFTDTTDLEYLEIRNNRLESLPSQWSENDMEGLQSLKHFDASENNITRIDSRLVTHLKSAIVINLSRNHINFESSDEVKHQNASSTTNGSTFQQSNLDPNVKLKRIDLSHNRIVEINNEVLNILKYSESIDLSYNLISRINISALSSALTSRDINEAGKMTISLRDNPLHCDCHMIDFNRFLAGQDENDSSKIIIDDREYYGGITCASPAELSGHPIVKIRPEQFSCFVETNISGDACNGTCVCREYPAKQVLSADCSHKNLKEFPPTIASGSNSSIELNMTGNMLEIASSFNRAYSTNITSLDLSDNNISKVTIDLFSPKLQILKLRGNHISRLDSNVIEYLAQSNSLQNITLHDNKWICDCESSQFLNFVQKTSTKYDFRRVKCNGTKQKIYQITANEFCSSTATIVIAVFSIVLLICVILAGLYFYKYRRGNRNWSYSRSYSNPPL